MDAEARPTTDPSAVLDGGALLPFGGHKGSGVSVLLEGLATALTSASRPGVVAPMNCRP